MRRLTGLLIFLITIFAVPATAGAADAGGLKQLSGSNGCFSDEDPVAAGCTEARAIAGVGDVVVSPDGENVYVTSTTRNAISIFDRNTTTGRLTQKTGVLGCITVTAATATNENCNLIAPADVQTLTNPTALALSNDNKSLYVVTTHGRVAGFDRAADGTLSFNNSSNLCGDTCPLGALAVSPDGTSVYPAGSGASGIIAVYRRNTTAGATLGDLSFRNCFSVGTCGTSAQNLGQISEVVVTPDNKQVLLTNSNNHTLLAWDRAVSGVNQGDVTTSTGPTRCVGNSDLGGTCQTRSGMITPISIALADNGTRVYVGANQELASVGRNASTGALTADGANCFGYPGSSFAGCTAMPSAGGCCLTFHPAREAIVTPDGQNLYLGTESSNPTIWGFTRGGGTLSLKPGALRCASAPAADDCQTFRQGNRVQEMSPAPGSRHVYAGGNDRIWAFELDRPPVCSNVGVNTAHNAAVTVGLSCSDPDGDAITYQTVGGPARGTLGAVQGSSVSYGPQLGTSGADSFQYRGVAAGVASDLATATVNVAGPPTGGGGGGGGGGNTADLIPSTVTNNWLAFPAGFTKVTNLSVNNLLAGTTVRVTCKTKGKSKKKQKRGCPYKSKRFTTSGSRAKLNLLKPFRKKRLPLGTKITIAVTVPGEIGKRFRYTMRKGKIPSKQLRCISPDGKISTCS